MLQHIAEVLINRPSKHLDRTFSYLIPDELKDIRPGYRCIVTFARRKEEGIILSVSKEDTDSIKYSLLPVEGLVDSFPWFTEEMIRTAKWISSYYMCTLIEALRLFYIDKRALKTSVSYLLNWENIPENSYISGIIDRSVEMLDESDAKLLFGDKISYFCKVKCLTRKEIVTPAHKSPLERWVVPGISMTESEKRRNKKQGQLEDYLAEHGPTAVNTLNHLGYSSSLIKQFVLKNRGNIIYKRKKTFSLVENNIYDKERVLTAEQKQAIRKISDAVDEGKYKGILLKGVTGSGKTEVYLRAARHVLEHNGSVLILVPEIALTDQMTSYFADAFGDEVVFIHSNLSKGERYNNRMRISNGESNIIIGSRSAIFMPFKNLKLIVVDEEYDSSYKQGETPRYNGRDVAKVMAVNYNCPIVLGAATPSIVTNYAAEQGKIEQITMNHRVFSTPLPRIYICDLKENETIDKEGLITRPLLSLLNQSLQQGNKSILLLNRRGFSTSLICSACGYVFKCPNCDVSLVYHRDSHQLKCHYCETVQPVPTECPQCHKHKILYLGAGTERVGDELQALLPKARCQRFDLDSTSRKNSAREILDNFRNGKIDILFGTQMLAKGHDIPGVQTVGILSADSSLNIPTYLASEQAFNLITQCAGRAGRGKEQGNVILQTYNPSHYVIRAAARQDYDSFYNMEVKYRKLLNFPPFTKLLKITSFNESEQKAKEKADRIYSWLKQEIQSYPDKISVTEPFSEPIRRVRNLYYFSILIKGLRLTTLKKRMRQASIFRENDIIIDVDPL